MRLDAVMVWGVSLLLLLLPLSIWQGLPLIPLLIAFSFPHFVATYVIWQGKVTSWRQEWAALGFPVAYLGLCWWAESGPGWVKSLPYQLTYLYLVYHFARQTYGAALWGGLRLGCQFTRPQKRWLGLWFLSVPSTAIYAFFAQTKPRTLFYHPIKPWILPTAPIPYLYLLLGVILVGTMISLGLHYHQQKKAGVLWPVVMLALPLIWFLPPFHASQWVPLIPLLHAIQYAPFWSKLLWASPTPWYKKCAHYLAFVAVGWLLFRWMPLRLVDLTNITVFYAMWIGMLNAHHFLIDGRIWKLSDEKNRALFTS